MKTPIARAESISIVIPTHQRSSQLGVLLESISSLTGITHCLEVLVISNLPDPLVDAVCAVASTNLNIRLHCSNRIGVNAARNIGLDFASNDICFFVDDDCQFIDESWYFEMQRQFAVKTVAAVGGFYKPVESISYAGVVYDVKIMAWLLRYANPENGTARRLVGGCMAIKKSALQGLKFNNSIFFGGTETELILKLVSQNKVLILSKKIFVLHDFNISLFSLLKKAYLQGFFHFSMQKSQHEVFSNQMKSFLEIQSELLKLQCRNKFDKYIFKLILFFYDGFFNFSRIKRLRR